MFKLFLILCIFLMIGGCRVSLTAEKLALYIQADEPAYLSNEDPALYDPEQDLNPDPVD